MPPEQQPAADRLLQKLLDDASADTMDTVREMAFGRPDAAPLASCQVPIAVRHNSGREELRVDFKVPAKGPQTEVAMTKDAPSVPRVRQEDIGVEYKPDARVHPAVLCLSCPYQQQAGRREPPSAHSSAHSNARAVPSDN